MIIIFGKCMPKCIHECEFHENMNMTQFKGFKVNKFTNKVYKLSKLIYGIKQALRD